MKLREVFLIVSVAHWRSARCSLKRLSAGPGFNPCS